ncbi:MAG TPA: rRNA maturation RNase YbeY, partial [Bacteroidaceae bacterium]|nr:rRNA maturation RNase YbeY [Bacteroidaceae bacterium]
ELKKFQTGNINIIFTSSACLLTLNQKYLNHNHHTDVITFDYSADKRISGDIYIGIEKVRENSRIFNVVLENELRRVMIHGILHLTGYHDRNDSERRIMRKMENEALNLWVETA